MNGDDSKTYPRLVMLSEFDGEIDGRLKFHKSLYQYRENVSDSASWAFRREERGPLDPGFSSRMQDYEDLDLVTVDEEGESHQFEMTEKGSRFVTGLKKGLDKLEDSFAEKRRAMGKIADRNKDRSGNEIVEDEEIKEAKEEPYQTDV